MWSLLIVFLLAVQGFTQTSDWKTFYEKSNFMRTPRYEETVAFCKRLAAASPEIHFTSFGKSPQGRDLPLLIIDKNGNFNPRAVRTTDNAVLLIQAGIHAGEIDGKDAGLMLFRDIALGKKFSGLLNHVTVLFIPIFNVDGHEHFSRYNRINQNGPEEMGWRVTAQNLNLNRDYLKADTPEMQAWLTLFQKWLPDFFIDCHVTDGADYQYPLTYAMETTGSMDKNLTSWTSDVYLNYMKESMAASGILVSSYIIPRKRHDPKSGLVSWSASPRYSEGYTAIQNRPGLLIETHMLKDYKTRVTATYEMLRHTIELLDQQHKALRSLVQNADVFSASPAFRRQSFPVRFRPDPKDSVMIDFLGVAYKQIKSDLSGGQWFQYSDKPATFHIPYFNKQLPAAQVDLPEAYIIPPEWTSIIERLSLHGVTYFKLTAPKTVTVKSYKFSDVKWQERPFEGRHTLTFKQEEIEQTRTFPAGSVVIDMNQRAARVAAHILEPLAPDSYLFWGFFDTIFEQKEYAETYVMEKMARRMLAENPKLKTQFENKKAKDADFAKNPRAILNWFYKMSPYWDERINVYPVGKIMDAQIVQALGAH